MLVQLGYGFWHGANRISSGQCSARAGQLAEQAEVAGAAPAAAEAATGRSSLLGEISLASTGCRACWPRQDPAWPPRRSAWLTSWTSPRTICAASGSTRIAIASSVVRRSSRPAELLARVPEGTACCAWLAWNAASHRSSALDSAGVRPSRMRSGTPSATANTPTTVWRCARPRALLEAVSFTRAGDARRSVMRCPFSRISMAKSSAVDFLAYPNGLRRAFPGAARRVGLSRCAPSPSVSALRASIPNANPSTLDSRGYAPIGRSPRGVRVLPHHSPPPIPPVRRPNPRP